MFPTGQRSLPQSGKHAWEFVSTGGTKTALESHGIKCRSVEEITNFPDDAIAMTRLDTEAAFLLAFPLLQLAIGSMQSGRLTEAEAL